LFNSTQVAAVSIATRLTESSFYSKLVLDDHVFRFSPTRFGCLGTSPFFSEAGINSGIFAGVLGINMPS